MTIREIEKLTGFSIPVDTLYVEVCTQNGKNIKENLIQGYFRTKTKEDILKTNDLDNTNDYEQALKHYKEYVSINEKHNLIKVFEIKGV